MQKNDNVLIQEIKNGNLSSFNTLIQKYERYVYKIAYGFGKSPDNALDIMQNVFLKVYEKLDTFKQQSSLKSWIGRICYNEGINWTRANKVMRIEYLNEKNTSVYGGYSEEDEYLAKEYKSELIHSLFALNTKQRLAVVLRYFEDMPIKDIAVTLHCSQGVVKNILFRSLRKLKENLHKKSNLE